MIGKKFCIIYLSITFIMLFHSHVRAFSWTSPINWDKFFLEELYEEVGLHPASSNLNSKPEKQFSSFQEVWKKRHENTDYQNFTFFDKTIKLYYDEYDKEQRLYKQKISYDHRKTVKYLMYAAGKRFSKTRGAYFLTTLSAGRNVLFMDGKIEYLTQKFYDEIENEQKKFMAEDDFLAHIEKHNAKIKIILQANDAFMKCKRSEYISAYRLRLLLIAAISLCALFFILLFWEKIPPSKVKKRFEDVMLLYSYLGAFFPFFLILGAGPFFLYPIWYYDLHFFLILTFIAVAIATNAFYFQKISGAFLCFVDAF